MGLSYDWSRKLQSHDPHYYRWNQFWFLQFLKHGLAYRKNSPVNWCPSCKTVLANEQAQGGICDRCKSSVEIKNLEQWFIRTTKYAEELLEIKTGNWTYEDVMEHAESLKSYLNSVRGSSVLPKEPDTEAINNFCMDTLKQCMTSA